MSLKLYEIAGEYRALISILENSEEDEIDSESFRLAIDALSGDFTAKATNIACLFRELSAESVAIQETARSLHRRAQRLDARAERLRDYLLNQMQTTGITRSSDNRISITLKRNPASVHIESPESLPLDYCRVIPARHEPDKTAIKTALKAGVDIPGCSLIQTQRLDIQ